MLQAASLLLVCVCAQAAIDKENFTTKKKYNEPHGNGFIQPTGTIQEHSNINERHRRRSMPVRERHPPVLDVTEEVILTKTNQATEELIINCMGQRPLHWHTPQCYPPCCYNMEDIDVINITHSISNNDTYPFTSTLKVQNHNGGHTGFYSCMYKDSTDNNPSMKASTYVYFHRPGKGVKLVGYGILDSFDAIHIAVGSTLVLDCRPTHPNDTVTLDFWGPVVPTADGRISFDPKRGYIIKNVTVEHDEGDYKCKPYKKISVDIKDKIPTLPKAVVEQPANQHFDVGEDITLICKPSVRDFGYVLEAKWITPRGSRLHDITYTGTETNPRSTLRIRNATMEDSGNYKCSISGPCKIYDQPEITTVPIQMKVIRVVTCLREPEKITLKPGVEIIFESPGYPSSYTPISNCGWKFRARLGSGNIKVTCSEFSLQPSREGRCPDWLALGKERFCGNNGPRSMTLGRKVKVTFRSNRKNNFAGFSCTASLDTEPSGK